MAVNLCGTCKHWGDEKDMKERFRQCRGVVHDVDFVADARRPDESQQQFLDKNKAVTQDASAYMAALRCREDFGCVLHEPI